VTPARIVDRVMKAASLRDLPSLLAELRDAPPEIVFDALFPVAVRRQGDGNPAAMSAYVLHALNPPRPIRMDDAVAALLPEWDVSIEEVPWYLAKQFGRAEVLDCVRRLRARETDVPRLTALRTVEYWVELLRDGE